MGTLTLEELIPACEFWKERLGLSHWRIGLRIARARDMPLGKTQGANEFCVDTEKALISILDPTDYPEGPFPQDMEATLVHELLHIPMRYIANPKLETLEATHMEAFIERMARLLVAMNRER